MSTAYWRRFDKVLRLSLTSEVIAALEASGANAVLDEDFARDVKESIQTYREPWNPPSVD
jgi:hypothetical protein